MTEKPTVEHHPLQPFLPAHAKLLMLGSFPPAQKRWCMPFFYPNFQNDMWRLVGLCFYGDKNVFVDEEKKTFRMDDIKHFLVEHGIAIYDTAEKVVRLKNTASDKDLEVVSETSISDLLDRIPECRAVVTTGQKATSLIMRQLDVCEEPKVGSCVPFIRKGVEMRLYRMPSSSRAYPMNIEKKAGFYKSMFEQEKI